MQKIVVLFFLLAPVIGVIAQPFSIGTTSLSLNDPDRQSRPVPFQVLYPADQPGAGVPVTAVVPHAFPVVVFGHGFVMEVGAYKNISDLLVPQGYIVVLPTTEGTFSPSHDAFGKDIAFLVKAFVALGDDTGGLFYNRIDTMVAVMGHSMGGGAAHLAAATGSNAIKAVATLAPAETTPSAIAAAASITLPALVIAGENDCVTPPATHQLPIYNGTASDIKTYISIIGGSHCLMAEVNLFCNIGELSCTPAPTITRQQQHTTINRYLLPWLNFHIKGDIPSIVLFEDQLANDTAVTFLTSGGLVPGITAPHPGDVKIRLYPNPAVQVLHAALSGEPSVRLTLYNNLMQEQLSVTTHHDTPIPVGHLAPGLYFYQAETPGGSGTSGTVIISR